MAPKHGLITSRQTSSPNPISSGRKSSTIAEEKASKASHMSNPKSKGPVKGNRLKLSTKLVEPHKFDIEKKVFASMEKKRKADMRKAEREKAGHIEPPKSQKEKEAEQKHDPKPTTKKPMTTTEKKTDSKKPPMPEKTKDSVISVKQSRVEKKTKPAGKKSTPPRAWQMLETSAAASSTKFEDKSKKTGVLFRATKRAVQEKKVLEKMNAILKKPDTPTLLFDSLNKAKRKKEEKPFEIMKFPEEVRNRIWKLVVVHHPFCVWPNQARGREQPDLAMSGRETRDEVLKVYYGANVFGIDTTQIPEDKNDKIPKPDSSKKSAKKTTGAARPDNIAEIKPWAEVLEAGGHLSQICQWVFSFTPEVEVEGRIPEIDDSKSLIVYLNIWREDGRWRANVEVHREACCVLPGHEAYQKCVIRNSPSWLNGMVGVIIQKAGRRGLTAEMLTGVATVLRDRAQDLVGVRCESPESHQTQTDIDLDPTVGVEK